MGTEVNSDALASPRAYREKLDGCLETLHAMHAAHLGGQAIFDDGPPRAGLELELALVDDRGEPANVGDAALRAIDDPAFVPEIGRWTIEYNAPPFALEGDGLDALTSDLEAPLDRARSAVATIGGTRAGPGPEPGSGRAHVAMVGILPTLRLEHLGAEAMTDAVRYRELDHAVARARGEDGDLVISGVEELRATSSCMVEEGAATSTQLHLKVAPERFAATYNAAQLFAGPQVALAANSPFFAGHLLWAETRIPLFTQVVDTRGPELRRQGVAPRVTFGHRWVDSVLDLFAEDVDLYPPLIPQTSDEDPARAVADGKVPALTELLMHTSTVWRWNRAVYDVAPDTTGTLRPHLRVENRILPAGPTPVDMVANAALFYGVVAQMVATGIDPRGSIDPSTTAEDFARCARDGLHARVTWPGAGETSVPALVHEHLLPLAEAGLSSLGVSEAVARRHLDVVEARASTGQTGSVWQTTVVASLEAAGASRREALAAMLGRYLELSETGEPVHTWSLEAPARR